MHLGFSGVFCISTDSCELSIIADNIYYVKYHLGIYHCSDDAARGSEIAKQSIYLMV